MNAPYRHIRKGTYRPDRRFRFQGGTGPHSRMINNAGKTLCGEPPNHEDVDKSTARHLAKHGRAIPQLAHWISDVCPGCLAQLDALDQRKALL